MVGIVDYKMGNLASVLNAFEKLGIEASIVNDGTKLKTYERLLLPGVGAFPDAMKHICENDLKDGVLEFAKSGKPLLGICLGMQLLFSEGFEFEQTAGLGLLDGQIVKFKDEFFESRHKIPQIGWNRVFIKQQIPLLKDVEDGFYLYFVHSYHAMCSQDMVVGGTIYGYEFPSIVTKNNIFGIQAHPEKSHSVGLKILENLCKLQRYKRVTYV